MHGYYIGFEFMCLGSTKIQVLTYFDNDLSLNIEILVMLNLIFLIQSTSNVSAPTQAQLVL